MNSLLFFLGVIISTVSSSSVYPSNSLCDDVEVDLINTNMANLVNVADSISKQLQDVLSRLTSLELKVSSTNQNVSSCFEQERNDILEEEIPKKMKITDEIGRFYCALKEGKQLRKGSCYFISSNKTTWSDAWEKCLQMNSNIVKIDDDEEFHFLSKLHATTGGAWLGLSDSEEEGRWTWAFDGSVHIPGDVSWWHEGEPSNHHGNEDCAIFNPWRSGKENLLNDIPCNSEVRYICEMPLTQLLF